MPRIPCQRQGVVQQPVGCDLPPACGGEMVGSGEARLPRWRGGSHGDGWLS